MKNSVQSCDLGDWFLVQDWRTKPFKTKNYWEPSKNNQFQITLIKIIQKLRKILFIIS